MRGPDLFSRQTPDAPLAPVFSVHAVCKLLYTQVHSQPTNQPIYQQNYPYEYGLTGWEQMLDLNYVRENLDQYAANFRAAAPPGAELEDFAQPTRSADG